MMYVINALDRFSEYSSALCTHDNLEQLQKVRDALENSPENENYIFIIQPIRELPTDGHYCPLHKNHKGICQICGEIL